MSALPETIGVADLAKLFNCTHRTIQNWAKKLGLTKAKRGEYPTIETVKAFRALELEEAMKVANKLPMDIKETEAEAKKETLEILKIKRQSETVKFKKQQLQLHDTPTVLMAFGGMLDNAKKQLLAIPAEMSPTLAKETDPTIVQQKLTDKLYTVLGSLSHYECTLSTAPYVEVNEADSEPICPATENKH